MISCLSYRLGLYTISIVPPLFVNQDILRKHFFLYPIYFYLEIRPGDVSKLREIIFTSDEEKDWLESLLHPAIARQIQDELKASTSPYSILVSPLLLETGQKDYCDKVLVVDVPVETQVERTLKRDGVSEAQVQSIIKAQISRQKRLELANEVIINDSSLEDLKLAVDQLHKKILTEI